MDYQQNFLASLAGGLQFGQDLKRQRDQTQLKGLASLAYGAPREQRQGQLAEMAKLDPGFAQAQQKAWNAEDDRDQKELISMARFIKKAPPEQQAAAYTNVVLPRLRARGMEAPDWSQDTQDTILQTVDALAQWDVDPSDTPTGYRDFELTTKAAGYTPGSSEYQQAARVKLGIEGRASNAGYGFFEIEGPDGRKRMGRNNPRTGAREIYDESTGDFVQIGGVGGVGGGNGGGFNTQPPMAPGRPTTAAEDQQFSARMNGIVRRLQERGFTPEQIETALPAFEEAENQASGAAMGDWGNPDSLPTQPRRTPFGAGPGRTKEEEAAAVEGAQLDTRLNYADRLATAEANAAAQKKMAEFEVERNAGAPARARKYEQALSTAQNVRSSIGRARGLVNPQSAGFGGARLRNIEGTDAYNLAAELETVKANLGFDRLQEMRDNSPTGGALGGIAIQELIALQSTVANLDPNQSPEQLIASLNRIDQHYSRWADTVRKARDEERSGGGGQRQAAPRPGDVRKGYRFKGGDPNQQSNWERI